MKKIDMHCHILPGIDDGSANPKETLAMLRMALNQDFVGMIVTPHGSVRNASVERVQEIRTLCKKFRIQAYQRLGVRLPVFPGQEIMYSVDTRQLLKEGKLLTLADSRYVLLEFLPGTAYSKIFSAVRQMQMAGYVPILAHVERYHVLREEGRLEERNTNSQKQIDEKSLLLNQEKLLRENCSLELSKIQLESSALEQQLSFISENENRVIGEIRKLKDEDASLEAGKNDSRKAIEEKEAAIIAIQKEIESSKEDDHQLEEEIQKTALEKEEVSKQQKNLFQTREDISKRLSDLDKDLFRVQSQAEKLEEHLESLAAYMWSEYEMTLNQAKELKKEELSSLPEIRRQIDALKEQIKSLGNINVNAIEDYREVSERYEFMRAQHEDLVNAQAELVKIIEELDIGMRRQFEEKFREIRAEFDKVFKELFGGGRGTLELMEGEDLLEAGIQIIAQPPGKKLQNMMQLSGGEKALTAISLLFAIQNLKPSPFCLLDEIEAALDDSNVDRFANYLHKLTKNTQFIVITHRRGTMMAADRLYGITMQEKGVSTLVSVNLIEDSLTK